MAKSSNKKTIPNPITASVSAVAMAAALSMSSAHAADNPFATSDLDGGFMLAGKDTEGKCGEGKCGGSESKGSEGKCGEGKCGEG